MWHDLWASPQTFWISNDDIYATSINTFIVYILLTKHTFSYQYLMLSSFYVILRNMNLGLFLENNLYKLTI